jgi:hypothetical protein
MLNNGTKLSLENIDLGRLEFIAAFSLLSTPIFNLTAETAST